MGGTRADTSQEPAVYVCFAPQSEQLLRCREMTRWATSRLMQCSKNLLFRSRLGRRSSNFIELRARCLLQVRASLEGQQQMRVTLDSFNSYGRVNFLGGS
jgi:hypothetical protein